MLFNIVDKRLSLAVRIFGMNSENCALTSMNSSRRKLDKASAIMYLLDRKGNSALIRRVVSILAS
jgi:hypothetical protein